MLNCLYKNKIVCSLEIRSKEKLNFDLEKELRLAGSKSLLKCEECGAPVILRAREVRIPHFAHKKGTNSKCTYGNIKETELHKKGKQILYNYFRKNYPSDSVIPEFRLSNGRRADIFVSFSDGNKLAIEFQNSELRFEKWQERHLDYKSIDVKDLWMWYGSKERFTNITKEYMLKFSELYALYELEFEYIMYLDVNSEEVTFLRTMNFNSLEREKEFSQLFHRTYPLDSIIITTDGRLQTDFWVHYDNAKYIFEEECRKEIEKEKDRQRSSQTNSPFNFDIEVYQRPKNKNKTLGQSKEYIEKKYSFYIESAAKGQEYFFNLLAKDIVYSNDRDRMIIENLFRDLYKNGMKEVKKVYLSLKIRIPWLTEWKTQKEPINTNISTFNKGSQCSDCRFQNSQLFSSRCENRRHQKQCFSYSPKD